MAPLAARWGVPWESVASFSQAVLYVKNYALYVTLQKLMYLVKYLSVLLGLLFPPAYMYTDTVFWMTI